MSEAVHAPHPHYKQYVVILIVLAVLTGLEIAVAMPSVSGALGMSKGVVVATLILMAIVKAALVGLYYMHLISETTVLKLMVGLPFTMLAVYAFVLIAEAAWRLIGPAVVMGAAS